MPPGLRALSQTHPYLLVRQDLHVASTDGSELVPGGGVRFHGVEVLKLLGDGMVTGRHRLMKQGQDL